MRDINWFTLLVLLITAILLICGKGAFLINGFNILNPNEKPKFHTKKLCKAMGLFLIYIDFLVFLQWIGHLPQAMCMIFIVVSCISFLIFINFTSLLKNDEKN